MIVVKVHHRVFGYSMVELKGISSSITTDKIFIKDVAKLVVDHQWRFNTQMKRVVSKVVTRLLDLGIIYPIYERKWVSLVHCVPKKRI